MTDDLWVYIVEYSDPAKTVMRHVTQYRETAYRRVNLYDPNNRKEYSPLRHTVYKLDFGSMTIIREEDKIWEEANDE